MSEKTEEPTPKRLQKAREEGDSGQSSALSQGFGFLVGTFALPGAIAASIGLIRPLLMTGLRSAAAFEPHVSFQTTQILGIVVLAPLPLLATVAMASGLTSFVQTGGFLATKKLQPKLDHLDVIKGVKELFSTQRLFSVARAFVTALVVAYLAHSLIRDHLGDLARLSENPQHLPRVAERMSVALLKRAAIITFVLGVLDVLVVRRAWKKRLMMGKDEVKREHKESDGDPQLKAAREKLHHELLAQSTVGNVKRASVVVVNPTHIACALRYDTDEGDQAPVLVASGEAEMARRIVEAARAYGVPVLRDVPLARALFELEIGDEIPEALYEAVALILREAEAERDFHEGENPTDAHAAQRSERAAEAEEPPAHAPGIRG